MTSTAEVLVAPVARLACVGSATGSTARSTVSSTESSAALDGWLDWYNARRPHGALSHKPHSACLTELINLPGTYI